MAIEAEQARKIAEEILGQRFKVEEWKQEHLTQIDEAMWNDLSTILEANIVALGEQDLDSEQRKNLSILSRDIHRRTEYERMSVEEALNEWDFGENGELTEKIRETLFEKGIIESVKKGELTNNQRVRKHSEMLYKTMQELSNAEWISNEDKEYIHYPNEYQRPLWYNAVIDSIALSAERSKYVFLSDKENKIDPMQTRIPDHGIVYIEDITSEKVAELSKQISSLIDIIPEAGTELDIGSSHHVPGMPASRQTPIDVKSNFESKIKEVSRNVLCKGLPFEEALKQQEFIVNLDSGSLIDITAGIQNKLQEKGVIGSVDPAASRRADLQDRATLDLELKQALKILKENGHGDLAESIKTRFATFYMRENAGKAVVS